MATAAERLNRNTDRDGAKPQKRVVNGNIPLGRIGGVEVRINWSWLVIFALIVWSLADGVFPSQNPGLSGGVHLAMAIVAALLFFASLLLHELGHSLGYCGGRLDYLERRPDPDDLRSKRVALTRRGTSAIGVIRDAVDEVEAAWA
jgi:hypothetical protein